MQILRRLAIASVFFFTGCTTVVGTDSVTRVPSDAAQTCAQQCTDLGLELGAVVVMANNVGCVCEPPKKGTGVSKTSASVGAGMAALITQEQVRQQQQQRRRSSNN